MELGQSTLREILTQTDAWAGALKQVNKLKQELCDLVQGTYRQIIFTGCGSTYYLSQAASSLYQQKTGLICTAVPGGELLMNPSTIYTGSNNLLFAISRSGSTSETVNSVRHFKEQQAGQVISISNYVESPLSKISDLALCIEQGQEMSIAQTRAFSSMYLAAVAVAMLASNSEDLLDEMERLPAIGKALIEKYRAQARLIGENLDIDRFYFLGSNHRYGLACEGSLKVKEMTLTHAEPFHFLEFRHGPISMVNDKTCIVGLLSDDKRAPEEKVLKEAREYGAQVVTLAEKDADISFRSGLTEIIRDVLYLPILQLTAFYRSIKKGLDPDKPKNLNAVVYLE